MSMIYVGKKTELCQGDISNMILAGWFSAFPDPIYPSSVPNDRKKSVPVELYYKL